jgi:hypothetical protein
MGVNTDRCPLIPSLSYSGMQPPRVANYCSVATGNYMYSEIEYSFPLFLLGDAKAKDERVFWDIAPCSLKSRPTFQRCVMSPSSGRWWWKQYASLKRRSTPTRQHGAISQKTLIFILYALRTWNLTMLECSVAAFCSATGFTWTCSVLYCPSGVSFYSRNSLKRMWCFR